MNKRTAIQILVDLKRFTGVPAIDDAASVIRTQHAEIERLSVALEAAQNALKEAIQDCREAYDKGRADQAVDDLPGELQIAAMSQDAQRLAGENAVLRDLLRDALSLIRNIECGCWIPEGMDNLRVRIDGAINGQGRYIPSDGQIYAETSRRADPKAHADFDRRLSMVLSHKPRDAK